jgi:hypothetical protein
MYPSKGKHQSELTFWSSLMKVIDSEQIYELETEQWLE